jgi:hypothetical protein
VDIQAKVDCPPFDGAGVQRLTAPGRAIRLRENSANPLRRCERLECRDGELGRAGETQP